MRASRAFTLIDLLAAIAVLTIVLAIGVPSLKNLVHRTQTKDATNRLVRALHLARSYAIKNGRSTVICKAAALACAQTGDWSQGWLIFEDRDHDGRCADTDRDGQCDADGGLIVRADHALTEDPIQITGNSHVSRRVRFSPIGATPGYNGKFTICGTHSVDGDRLILHTTGRMRSIQIDELCDTSSS